MRPDPKVLQRLFPVGHKALMRYSDWLRDNYPEEFASSSGWVFPYYFDTATGRQLGAFCPPECKAGSSRLLVHGIRRGFDPGAGVLRLSDVSMRVDVPVTLENGGKYSLYHLRFTIDNTADQSFCDPFFRGYIGVTKRHPFDRLKEHHSDMLSGKGYALHTAWRALVSTGIPFAPCFQVCGFADTLKEIYEAEEDLVAKYTLAPTGLNAIPGGLAGIRMLHKLALLSGRKLPGVAERDAALARLEQSNRKGPCAHYRRGHVRRIADTITTWVSPCWVALKAA